MRGWLALWLFLEVSEARARRRRLRLRRKARRDPVGAMLIDLADLDRELRTAA